MRITPTALCTTLLATVTIVLLSAQSPPNAAPVRAGESSLAARLAALERVVGITPPTASRPSTRPADPTASNPVLTRLERLEARLARLLASSPRQAVPPPRDNNASTINDLRRDHDQLSDRVVDLQRELRDLAGGPRNVRPQRNSVRDVRDDLAQLERTVRNIDDRIDRALRGLRTGEQDRSVDRVRDDVRDLESDLRRLERRVDRLER